MKWKELEKYLERHGYSLDSISTDAVLIEQQKCKSKHNFEYIGMNNGVTYLAIGICRRCDYAQIFPNLSQNASGVLNVLGAKKVA